MTKGDNQAQEPQDTDNTGGERERRQLTAISICPDDSSPRTHHIVAAMEAEAAHHQATITLLERERDEARARHSALVEAAKAVTGRPHNCADAWEGATGRCPMCCLQDALDAIQRGET